MRSLYAKILLWCFATLLMSLVAFVLTSRFVFSKTVGKGGPFERMMTYQAEDAASAYESGGKEKLAAALARMDHHFGPEHHLVDSQGRDVITGEDRRPLLERQPSNWSFPGFKKTPHVMSARTPDRRYRLMIVVNLPFTFWNLAPYYLWILGAVALLCWLLASKIASPIKELAAAVRRFGAGDLSARARLKRRDEIGDVAHAFDEMAERIQTLMSAERQLLQDISHELRSPLARMSFAAELARTAPDRDAAVARLKKEIQRLTDLVGALLQVTRVEGDPASRKMEPLSLEMLLQDLAEDCWVEADARGCKVDLRVSGPAEVRGDRELIRRAIENVFRNAIRYAPEGSRIEVTLQPNGDSADVSVRDYGPGVPDDALPHLFRPFYRADPSRDNHTGGVGLGLAIAARAVSLHHGALTAENAHPGLRVSMSLPIIPSHS